MSDVIRRYLADKKYNTAPDDTYNHIQTWKEWYQNDVTKFHTYNIYNGTSVTAHKRHRLGMAKKICEDWANLLLNEKVAIKAGEYESRLNEILRKNNFRVRGNQLIEIVFALGTGAFVEYLDGDGEVIIDYIRADMIYPLSWDNGDITECAFGTTKVIGGKETVYLQIHRLGREVEDSEEAEHLDEYYIENKYVDAESGKEIDAPDEIISLVETGSTEPLFQIITPNICNNIDMDSPLGISVYANCISQLKGCDLVYDSYMNEFVLGRKRIIVPMSAAQINMQRDGIIEPTFDADDTVYYQMPQDKSSDLKLTEVDMTIRAQEHELGIQRSLDMLSLKSGMGTGRYQFDSSGVKTATEVISDRSDLYQNRQKHCILIEAAVLGMVRAVSFLDKGTPVEATVDFDDSIIEDSNAIIDKNIKLVNAGLRSKKSAIMEIDGCSEKDAEKEMELIAQEGQITGQDIDWTQDDEDEKSGWEIDDQEEEDDVDEPTGKPAGGGSGR